MSSKVKINCCYKAPSGSDTVITSDFDLVVDFALHNPAVISWRTLATARARTKKNTTKIYISREI